MNLNELADKLAKEWVLHDKNVGTLMKTSAEFLYTQSTMLRQQQIEIETLKINYQDAMQLVCEYRNELMEERKAKRK